MPKVILQISYEIEPGRREEFISLIRQMKSHFSNVRGKHYEVFEVRGKPNAFVEQFTCHSMDEFEALEDDLDETSEELVNKLETMLKNGKTKYSTLVQYE